VVSVHEWKAVRKVIDKLNQKKPKKAVLKIGEMVSDSQTFMEIFKEYVRGTELEEIELKVESVPVEAKCDCGWRGGLKVLGHLHFVRCPKCGKIVDVLKGNELEIVSVE
jgi:Zn finger protein HypA/HybF involved in hydrogenase expression